MNYIKGSNRDQIVFSSLEIQIEPENPVRFVDAFVDHLGLDKLGFVVNTLKTEGRPGFKSKLFWKIYLYGYLNGIRFSGKLEN